MQFNLEETKQFSREIRQATLECIHSQGNGHIGGSLSVADILAVLYHDVLNIDPKNPKMDGRDRLVLSKGHAGPALYATLALKGYFPREWLKTLNKLGTKLPSHCNMDITPGVDMTAGSLGQGISSACGLALGSKTRKDSATIFAIVGDGEMQEGSNYEGIMFAGAHKLNNLVVMVDNNGLQLDGKTSDIMPNNNFAEMFASFNFYVQTIDGHSHKEIFDAIQIAKQQDLPSAIICNTVKGKGVDFYETMGAAVHSTTVDAEQYKKALEQILNN